MTDAGTQNAVSRLSVGVSPHIREKDDVRRIMWTVVAALAPVGLAALFLFGWHAGAVIATCVASCAAFESIWQKLTRRPVTVGDGSAVVTGVLLAYIMPPNVPLFVAVVASGVSIIVAKQLFGGLGFNIWNPALIGRAFAQIAYPALMTPSAWPILSGSGFTRIFQDIRNAAPAGSTTLCSTVSSASPVMTSTASSLTVTAPQCYDAVSAATPLALDSVASFAPDASGNLHLAYPSLRSLFLGNVPGCLGETSAVLIILGGIWLIYKGYINWRVPFFYLGSLFLFAFFFPTWKIAGAGTLGGLPEYQLALDAPGRFFFPMYQVLAGGVMLGAFFMATDMVTTPITSRGQVIFAVGCGLITAAIRLLGHGFPEGCCYSILLMNTATPLIDRYTRPTKYGAVRAGGK